MNPTNPLSRWTGPLSLVVALLLTVSACGLGRAETSVGTIIGPPPDPTPTSAPAVPTTAPVDVDDEVSVIDDADDTAGDEASADDATDDTPADGERGTRVTEVTDSSDSAADEPVETATDSTDATGASPDVASPDAVSPDAATEATESRTLAATSGDCLEGRWITAPGEIERYVAAIAQSTAGAGTAAVEMTGSGYLIVVLEGGRYNYDARLTISMNIDGFAASSVVDGVTQGSYEYDNGFIVANEEASSIDAYVDAGGIRLDANELGLEFGQAAVFHEVPFDCGDGDATLHFEVAPGVERHPIRFIPWDGTRP